MIRKTLIALAAAATLGLGMASTAQAKTNIDIDFGIGLAGGYGHGYGYGYGGDWYEGDECFYKIKSVKKWNHAHTHYKIIKKKVLVCY